jgi:hypothetical protein
VPARIEGCSGCKLPNGSRSCQNDQGTVLGRKKWDAASLCKSSIAAPGQQVGLFNAHHLLKLDKIDFIEGGQSLTRVHPKEGE